MTCRVNGAYSRVHQAPARRFCMTAAVVTGRATRYTTNVQIIISRLDHMHYVSDYSRRSRRPPVQLPLTHPPPDN